jgi:two-component system osmolarity sensor histidine kinase EnvZ
MSDRWRRAPASLFSRAVVTLTVTFGLFALITFFAVVQYGLVPVADRSTRDLASLMLLSIRTLTRLSPEQQDEYRDKIYHEYGLSLLPPGERPRKLTGYYFHYANRLAAVLEDRLGYPVEIKSNLLENQRWFWAELRADGETLWIGFPRHRIGSRPLEGILLILLVLTVLVVVTAAQLARRVSAPLDRLSRAIEQVAKGISPAPLSEAGPRELSNLACQFNEMSRQVREILANRTVLLAGISHDIRTPLTRLRLALEMLPEKGQSELIQRIEHDLDEINGLITQAAALDNAIAGGERRVIDLSELLTGLCHERPRVIWQPPGPCHQQVDPLSLRRIVGNLLENALRYSHDLVEVRLDCHHAPPVIFVLDRGPGIPEQEREAVFRPFYRLEGSRSRSTGGSGLGLAIARQLAVANGIEIRLDGRRGRGTVASIHLPHAHDA